MRILFLETNTAVDIYETRQDENSDTDGVIVEVGSGDKQCTALINFKGDTTKIHFEGEVREYKGERIVGGNGVIVYNYPT